jgi:hypothetical protein
MFFQPGFFFTCKNLIIVKGKILLIQVCLKKRVYNGDGVYGFFTVPSDTPLDIEIQP